MAGSTTAFAFLTDDVGYPVPPQGLAFHTVEDDVGWGFLLVPGYMTVGRVPIAASDLRRLGYQFATDDVRGASSGITVSDSFNRPDAATLGSPEHGPTSVPWSVLGGQWGIDAGRAYTYGAASAGVGGLAVVDHGWSDGTISLAVAVQPDTGSQAGVAFRFTNANNGWVAAIGRNGFLTVEKIVGGSVIGVLNPGLAAGPCTISVTLDGPTIRVYRNGAEIPGSPFADAFNQAASIHGITIQSSTTDRLDDYSAVPT